jgi:peroxiredoxin
VLLDFWASWCRPCRQENPQVVKIYNRFKDNGFEILGISLDESKEQWLEAIEKDQLPWRHVSDFKGGAGDAARLYHVEAIPMTVLLDEDGRITALNLRGRNLEEKLTELLGE